MNLYERLGILKDATAEQVKTAYRKLAQRHHPDKGGDMHIFQGVQEAYDTLSDSDKRAEYDATGTVGPNKPPLRDQAIVEFGGLINAFLNSEQFDFDHANLIVNMREAINSKLSHLITQREQVEAKIARSENAKARLSIKDGQNFIAQILDNMIQGNNQVVRQIKSAEAVQSEMLLILDDFEYRVDERSMPSYPTWATFTAQG